MMLVSFSVLALAISLTEGFSLVRPVENKHGGSVNLVITLREGTSGVVEGIKLRRFASREQRHVALVESLKQHSTSSQKPVLEFLNKEKLIKPGLRVESLWITNQIVIKGADFNLISRLSALPQVSTVEEERFFQLDQPGEFQVLKAMQEESSSLESSNGNNYDDDYGGVRNSSGHRRRGLNARYQEDEQQWGIVDIQAPPVWSQGNIGQNVTVCTIGTGARATHEALRENYVGNDYGWYDPVDGTSVPEDPLGIGTHTIGIISGSVRGIGVAPGSKWSACKACGPTGVCYTGDILSCAQWVLCPDPDCSRAPRVVNNVWGSGNQGDEFFDAVLQAWTAAGIIPVFPIGGGGPSCNTASSPGDSALAIGVGASTRENVVYEGSSAGPGPNGRIKPDVVAPGQNILSAFPTSDTAYASVTGTSLASPHVAGLAALILREKPDASFTQVRSLLVAGGENLNPSSRNCGDVPETQLPNFVAGYGRINALKSLSQISSVA